MKKKIQYICIWIVALMFMVTTLAYGQDSPDWAQSYLNSDVSESSMIQFSQALDRLEEKFNVSFIYKVGLLNDLLVDSDAGMSDNFGQELIVLLELHNLTYVELNNRTFALSPNSDEKHEKFDVIQNQVQGLVTDAQTGEALPGVTIMVLGTNTGVATDMNGEFELTVPELTVTLVFSYVGYLTQEVDLDGRTEIHVSLEPTAILGEELVVVGYTERSVNDLTGSVVSVKADDISVAPASNLSQSLGGRLPGVVSLQGSGEPGYDGADISIRGFGNALVIVDGVPGNYTQLDPNSIESITVLKDASAAVYGVRAANGVILVETKSGSEGKTTLNYNGYYGIQRAINYPDLTTAAEHVLLVDEGEMNEGRQPVHGREVYEEYRNGERQGYDWYDLAVRSYAPQQQHTLSADGGTEKIQYFLSLGYLDQEGQWRSKDTNYQRYNMRTKVDAQITDAINVSLNVSGRIEDRNTPGLSAHDLTWGIIREDPRNGPYANDNKDYYNETNVPFFHPVALQHSEVSGYNDDRYNNLTGIMDLEYEFPSIEGLTARAMGSYKREYSQVKNWSPAYNFYQYNAGADTYEQTYTGGTPTELQESLWEQNQKLIQLSLNYKNTFADKHSVEGLVLFEQQEVTGKDFWSSREYELDGIEYLFAGLDENKDNGGGAWQSGNRGVVGRAYYSYDNRYMGEVVFRYDGSALFPQDSRWGFFPAVSAGWRISEEPFMQNLEFVDNLKLRASYGIVGDDDGANYQHVAGFTYPSGGYIFGNSVKPGIRSRGLANENLTWYESRTTNIGLDATIIGDNLDITVDVFRRERTGLLATRQLSLPGTFGASLPQENLNADSQRGFELVLGHQNSIGKFNFDVSGNVSYTRRQMEHVERAPFTNSYQKWRNAEEGRWTNLWWGYEAIGRFQSEEEINNWMVEQDGQGNRTLLPGDIKYRDYNEDGVINDLDMKPIGRQGTPAIMYGLNVKAAYKNFDLAMFFQGGAKFNTYYYEEMQVPLFNNANSLNIFMDRWHHEDPYDPSSPWVEGKFPATRPSGSQNNTRLSTFWMQDASYLRLKNLQIGYNIPASLTQKLGISNARVYVNGTNIYTFDSIDYINIDPENQGTAGTGHGLFYPLQQIWNLGINITF